MATLSEQGVVPDAKRRLRLGGLVLDGSVRHFRHSTEMEFVVTDLATELVVRYRGALPDLFREGQGVVALGRMEADGSFRASEVLARHDETYMPPEVQDALRRSGQWKPERGAPPPAATWNTLDVPATPNARAGS